MNLPAASVCSPNLGKQVDSVLVLSLEMPLNFVAPAAISGPIEGMLRAGAPGANEGFSFISVACPVTEATAARDCSRFFILGVEAPPVGLHPRMLLFMFQRAPASLNLVGMIDFGLNAYPAYAGGEWKIGWEPFGVPSDWLFQPIK